MDPLATPKGKMVKLSDGKEYQFPPMNLTVMADLEEAFDCDMEELDAIFDRVFGIKKEEKGKKGKQAATANNKRTATDLRKILWVLLQQDNPTITLRETGKLVGGADIGNVARETLRSLYQLKG